ncbi:MetQ/NlpA family ABC transporter substrate-binding protein [Bacillus sp. 2205SS5-2]|uniref:MetQ/NlpA family ABC transporter substrate-binding protein n=1 Tax=Bacillus sp. 2205SS5-2 TaxID=3109031 RepID=UPI003007B27F
MKNWIKGLALASVFTLAACGNGDDADNKIVIGASNIPHAEILEKAAPLLEEKGYELEIETYQDYVLPNKDLENGDLDANYFQHIPYLNKQIDESGYDFVNAGGIHIEPIGVYSQKYNSLDELPEGAEILLSSSVPDHGRILSLLEEKGLISLKEGVEKTEATLEDIVENPKNLQFDYEYEAALLPELFKNGEGDAVLINSNYAIDAELNPLKDSIAIENSDSPYTNIITVRSEDKENEGIQALVEVLRSKEIQDYILAEWNGVVVPVSQ